jgi:tryptophanyl-tRNA synthetase
MAADILLYGSEVVPVGEDQAQHVELARTIARKFNAKFGKTFAEPKPLLGKALRIKSLVHPDKKMSKSHDTPLNLTDSPEEIRRKLKKAVTATDAKGASAGVDNLFVLLREFGTREQIEFFENERAFGGLKFSELKEALGDQIAAHFAPFRERRAELLADKSQIAEILGDGAHAARAVAGETLAKVKALLGLL